MNITHARHEKDAMGDAIRNLDTAAPLAVVLTSGRRVEECLPTPPSNTKERGTPQMNAPWVLFFPLKSQGEVLFGINS